MTINEVKARVAEIAGMIRDDEMAHSNEDDLHQAVLHAISVGECDDPAACAREALKTLDLDFERWCA